MRPGAYAAALVLCSLGHATAVQARSVSVAPSLAPLLLYATPDRAGHGYVVQATIIGTAADAMGRTLQAHADGTGADEVRVVGHTAGDVTVCDAPERLSVETPPPVRDGSDVLLGTFDPNPASRFALREASTAVQGELLDVLRIMHHAVPAVAALHAQPQAASSWVLSDQASSGQEIALLSISAVTDGAEGSGKATLFAALVRSGDGAWRLSSLEQAAGCDACDAVPATTRPRAVGDFDRDGRLDLLLEDSGYESWTYRWLKWTGSGWIDVARIGGGGC